MENKINSSLFTAGLVITALGIVALVYAKVIDSQPVNTMGEAAGSAIGYILVFLIGWTLAGSGISMIAALLLIHYLNAKKSKVTSSSPMQPSISSKPTNSSTELWHYEEKIITGPNNEEKVNE